MIRSKWNSGTIDAPTSVRAGPGTHNGLTPGIAQVTQFTVVTSSPVPASYTKASRPKLLTSFFE